MSQPCLSCGRDTAAGTALFSARKRGLDTLNGEEGFLCQACQAGSAVIDPDQVLPASGRFAVINMQGMQNG